MKKMNPVSLACRESGSALIVGLIMLLLFTLLVTSAFMMSNTNLKSVGNMQARTEVLSAANFAINQVMSSDFTKAPKAEQVIVDINSDGTDDFTVDMAVPVCLTSKVFAKGEESGTDVQVPKSDTYSTLWELQATVDDPMTGANVRVRSGVRVVLDQTTCDNYCSAVAGTPCV